MYNSALTAQFYSTMVASRNRPQGNPFRPHVVLSAVEKAEIAVRDEAQITAPVRG